METRVQSTAEEASKKEEASSEGACGLTLPDAYAKDCKKCNFSNTERATDDRPEPIKDGDFDRSKPIADTPPTHPTPGEGSVHGEGSVIERLQGDAEIARLRLEAAHVEIARLRLTHAEREAVKSCIWDYEQNDDDADCARMVATLRGLLERMI